MSFIPALIPAADYQGQSHWLVFAGTQLLIQADELAIRLPTLAQLEAAELPYLCEHYLGTWEGQACYVRATTASAAPPGLVFKSLRALLPLLSPDLFSLAGRAAQVAAWDLNHRYCGRCATPMQQVAQEYAKRCPACGLVNYPRLAPAVIMRVTRGEEILLSRAPHFAPGMYSVQAGFVEPGETLEDAVRRELREEVNLEVSLPQYFGSQPWPFPHSLMLAFTAEYAGGELRAHPQEVEEARWWSVDALPALPPAISIAYQLVADFVAEVRHRRG